MSNAFLLRIHRWITLIFGLPLLVVVVTGLILSVQPIVQTIGLRPDLVSTTRLEALVAQHDPQGKGRGLSVDPWDNTLTLAGVGEDGALDIDLATGAESDADSNLSDLFSASRRLHQRLVFRMGWLVTASTIAMLCIIALGVLMGWPRWRNTLSGWHKGVAWVTLPLVILSPLTGLLLAFNIGGAEQRGARTRALPLIEALRIAGTARDGAVLTSLGTRGGRMLARYNDTAGLRVFVVTREGVAPAGQNWPRVLHEGTWLGVYTSLANVVTSFAILGLLGTGLWMWGRRTLRRRKARAGERWTHIWSRRFREDFPRAPPRLF